MAMTSSPSTTARSGSAARSGLEDLGEVPVERALVAAAELDLVAVAEHDAAEPVPLRLVGPSAARRELAGQLRQHRRDRGRDRERHPATLPRAGSAATGRRPARPRPRRGQLVLAPVARTLRSTMPRAMPFAPTVRRTGMPRGRRRRTSRRGSRRGRRRGRRRRRRSARVEPLGGGARRLAGVASPGERDEVDGEGRERGGPARARRRRGAPRRRRRRSARPRSRSSPSPSGAARRRRPGSATSSALGVLRAELEDVADLDAAVDGAAATRSAGTRRPARRRRRPPSIVDVKSRPRPRRCTWWSASFAPVTQAWRRAHRRVGDDDFSAGWCGPM